MCPGDRPTKNPTGKVGKLLADGIKGSGGTTYDGDCKMTFKDIPNIQYNPKNETANKNIRNFYLFIGIVWDRCRLELRDIGVFEIRWQSKAGKFKVGKEWDGDLTKKPVRIHRIPKHQKGQPQELPTNHKYKWPT